MDPSALQSDKDNDVHSLEGVDTVVESDAKAKQDTAASTSTSGSSTPENQSPNKDKKLSFLHRLWQRFNIYLLLFILLVLVAIGVTIFLVIRGKNETPQGTLQPQNLSTEALKQLSNSDVTIGSSKQVLNVASNAVFAGSLLVRNQLEVAGSLKVGGELTLPDIIVSGASKFGQVQADTLSVNGVTNVQGRLTVHGGMNVTGDSTFNGNVTASQLSTGRLQLNGDLVLTNHVTAGGAIPGVTRGNALGAGGTTSVSGSDTSGSLTINTGSGAGPGCFATITFTKAFSNTPHVVITPIGSGAAGINYYVTRSTSNMSICTVSQPPSGQSFGFDYMVLN